MARLQETTKHKLVEVSTKKNKLRKRMQAVDGHNSSIRELRQERLAAEARSEQLLGELNAVQKELEEADAR